MYIHETMGFQKNKSRWQAESIETQNSLQGERVHQSWTQQLVDKRLHLHLRWSFLVALCPVYTGLLIRKLHFAANCPLSLKKAFQARRVTLEAWCEEVSKARKAKLKGGLCTQWVGS